jgi:hypothetical protein
VLAVPAAQAATVAPPTVDAVWQVSSYSDLIKPIPNAVAILKASAAARANVVPAEPAAEGGKIEQVQYRYWHRRHWRHWRWRHHHHHHHHHHNT